MRRFRAKYSWEALAGDCFGGAIAALIALPYGLAMASLMGLPPVLGIFTSILTGPVTALLGRNPLLIGGTASATVPFVAIAVRQQGIGGAAKISIAASIFMLVFCALHLGKYAHKVPQAVVSGFSCGIGAMMLISQLDVILGIASPASKTSSSTFGNLADVVMNIGHARWTPAVLGISVIVAAALAARWSNRAPSPLIGIGVAFVLAQIIGIHEKEVGALPLSIPPFAGFAWNPSDVYTVIPSAFALALVSSVNTLITSRVVEHFRGQHHHVKKTDADQELGAFGIANIVAGMFAAPMSVGIPARSLAAVRCGATTRVANFVHVAFLIAFLELGAGFVAHIPIAALAGVTAWMGICLLDWSTWKRLPKMRRVDALAFGITAVAVLAVNAVAAIAMGCLVYAGHAIYLKSRPRTEPALDRVAQAS
ncbi:MAG: SulP family inorganic anion transporter [Bryobacteraceae bacterium]|jgi:SulP family sulfate permease